VSAEGGGSRWRRWRSAFALTCGRAAGAARRTGPRLRILFVCTGNICRSPTAEGVFGALVAASGLGSAVEVRSAGTHGGHRAGEPPDPRAVSAARRRGIEIGTIRARALKTDDFHRFDRLIALDRYNYETLLSRCPRSQGYKIHLLMHFAPESNTMEVADPYGGGAELFEQALDRIEAAARGLLVVVQREWLPAAARDQAG
jgi:protein-tyrosine phosphatase